MDESEIAVYEHLAIEKARERYARIADLESELERHQEAAKDAKKRIDGLQSEIRLILTQGPPAQMELSPPADPVPTIEDDPAPPVEDA